MSLVGEEGLQMIEKMPEGEVTDEEIATETGILLNTVRRTLLKTRLEFEENNVFYSCPQGCVRLLFDEATETEFLCPMCGEDLAFYDNSYFIEVLKKRVDALSSA